MSDVLNGVVPVKDGFSFARNLVIQLNTKLNLARMTEIRRLQGTGRSVHNPKWRDTNGHKAYEQTIVFGVDEIVINGHYQHASIFTAIHEESTPPGPCTCTVTPIPVPWWAIKSATSCGRWILIVPKKGNNTLNPNIVNTYKCVSKNTK